MLLFRKGCSKILPVRGNLADYIALTNKKFVVQCMIFLDGRRYLLDNLTHFRRFANCSGSLVEKWFDDYPWQQSTDMLRLKLVIVRFELHRTSKSNFILILRLRLFDGGWTWARFKMSTMILAPFWFGWYFGKNWDKYCYHGERIGRKQAIGPADACRTWADGRGSHFSLEE